MDKVYTVSDLTPVKHMKECKYCHNLFDYIENNILLKFDQALVKCPHCYKKQIFRFNR